MEAILGLLAVIPWKQILAWAMPLIILGVVHLIKKNYAGLKPYIPIIAPILGAVLPFVGAALGGFLGIAIDFSPILDALTGAMAGMAAVGLHQIAKQRQKVKDRQYA